MKWASCTPRKICNEYSALCLNPRYEPIIYNLIKVVYDVYKQPPQMELHESLQGSIRTPDHFRVCLVERADQPHVCKTYAYAHAYIYIYIYNVY